ncbi:IS3 family transposase [Thioalkalivibrio versutus]|uniref:IS3 family transposase n=1 Tax=Thioalkalivibrio versutus TaxID=106634 RepID=UPI0009851D63|nr:IS3 family transposase [Thioalkalivibrio versutus]
MPAGESPENLAQMRRIDDQYLQTPFFGSRQTTHWLQREGYRVNRKRIQRLMALMGPQVTVPGPHTSRPQPENLAYPHLLRRLSLTHSHLVWCADITYIPMPRGFMYLMAVMDWFNRHVVSWSLSNTLDTRFCMEAWRWLWTTARRSSSIPARGPSSPAPSGPSDSSAPAFSLAWMAKGAPWTTSLSSACGAP